MKLQELTDVLGQKYIGLDINPTLPDSKGLTLNDMLEVGLTEIPYFKDRNENLLNRNSNKYHLTVFSVAECGKNKDLFNTLGTEIEIRQITYNGIGSIWKDTTMATYFAVVDCPYLNDIRYASGLEDKHLHITIAYTHKDLFHAPKNDANVWKP